MKSTANSLSINAVVLQYILVFLIVLVLGLIVGLSWMANSSLADKASETDHARIDSMLAQDEISRLKQLQKNLAEDKDAIAKAAQIVAESQMYSYQDQVVNDLTAFSKSAGVTITGFEFNEKPTAGDASSSAQKTSTQRKTLVTILLANEVKYTSLLTFIKAIEQNITRMQLTGISIQPSKTDPSIVIAPRIEIEVYLR